MCTYVCEILCLAVISSAVAMASWPTVTSSGGVLTMPTNPATSIVFADDWLPAASGDSGFVLQLVGMIFNLVAAGLWIADVVITNRVCEIDV